MAFSSGFAYQVNSYNFSGTSIYKLRKKHTNLFKIFSALFYKELLFLVGFRIVCFCTNLISDALLWRQNVIYYYMF